MEYFLEVEWVSPSTDVHYYKLKFRSLVEMDEKQVMVPKSNDPKSRYILTGLIPVTEHVTPVKDSTEGKPSSVTARTVPLSIGTHFTNYKSHTKLSQRRSLLHIPWKCMGTSPQGVGCWP
ncbi:tenascin-N-like [Poecile atricapillus]|uniref:tenascin-N-like n=1 Tax=Poecile atricapillus TaxID=48891 RepID=UPI00273825F7|nr:tenascin-N-like [Poecile atricapillus]